LDIPRLLALGSYWRQNPPVHQLLAAFVGYKPPADDEDESINLTELAQFFRPG
jgi:hypothetical protein